MKTLVVYYSYSNNTRQITEKIKQKLNCDILELKPKIPFSKDYQTVVDEYQNNESEKKTVEIENINLNLDNYDKIILGTPVWWYTITPPIRTFLKNNDLTNKEIYVFATNAGWLGRTFDEIKKICNGNIKEEISLKFEDKYLTNEQELDSWINNI
ncbi:MAG: NAD(P)H-dependent oxidoreductase [Bacilli bacterium]|nr:NAD(P)H-dependent oxidoreductase [Bacilli bacterium]